MLGWMGTDSGASQGEWCTARQGAEEEQAL